MKRVLIIGSNADTHVSAVAWGLETLGFEFEILDFSKFPSASQISCLPVDLEANGPIRSEVTLNSKTLAGFDVVWNRRMGEPTPSGSAHPSDIEIISRESLTFSRAVCGLMDCDDTIWINPFIAGVAAENKLRQLKVAKRCGFRTPKTIATNDASKLEEFAGHIHSDLIYKPFHAGGWNLKSGGAFLSTSKFSLDNIGRNQINLCPGIYQEEIKKSADVRIMFCNKQVSALRIQATCGDAQPDWRRLARGDVIYRSIAPPADIVEKCSAYCNHLGLRYAAFDFSIEKNSNEWYFLEANQAGQFLWMEQADAETQTLNIFISGLLGLERVPAEISFRNYLHSQKQSQ